MHPEEPQAERDAVPWAELGEFGLIRRLNEILPVTGPGVLQSGGDDAAVLAGAGTEVLLLTTDVMVEERHFRRSYPPEAVGHRLLAANLSDIAAMGGRPLFGLFTLAIPKELAADYVDRLAAGMGALASRHGVSIVGGDTSTSPGPLFLAVTLVGRAPEAHVKYRHDAQPGQLIFVTGTLGRSALGLAVLERTAASPGEADELLELARRHHLYPEPPVAAGPILGALSDVGALIDVSDGLSSELQHVAAASQVTMVVEPSRLPVPDGFGAAAAAVGLDARSAVLHAGEEFELVGTVQPAGRQLLTEGLREAGLTVTVVGEVRPGPPRVLLRHKDGSEEPLEAGGWRHF